MKSFYECSFFQEKWDNRSNFSVKQKELKFKNIRADGKLKFEKIDVLYKCSWIKQKDWSLRPTIIIPIKDNSELLRVTLKNLIENKIDEIANIIIVDDRSSEDIESIVLEKKFSYLRIENEKGFNFSMLNNIPAKICNELGIETIILWNSDLWCKSREDVEEIINRHAINDSKISGSKLIYPTADLSLRGEEDTKNIEMYFSSMKGKWRNTVQFGGDAWVETKGPILYSPIHQKRFSEIDNHFVNCDKGCAFVTGALQVIDLSFFISIGGMNPSLSKVFQDVDLCLRTNEKGRKVYYFGKDLYFYHDESANHNNIKGEKKNDKQFESDHFLFGKIWNNKIGKIIW